MSNTTKVIKCPCGTVFSNEDQEQLVAMAQRHAKETHDTELTREQALSMAQPA
jgi:hypothetical protein